MWVVTTNYEFCYYGLIGRRNTSTFMKLGLGMCCVPSRPFPKAEVFLVYTRIKNIKNVTRCRDSRSAKSIETR